ncbi:calponin homolog [Echinococcus multilocularis]|nr:calponin homolog [Echinococcus multilocularis]
MSDLNGETYSDSSAYLRLNSRYDANAEQEVVQWISQIVGETVPLGRENVQRSLKDGKILVRLIDAVYERTSHLPPAAQSVRRPLKPNTMSAPFKQMENIQIFLDATEAYGVPKTSLFQTVDLYESRNMSQVINTLMQLGTECQRNGFQGPTCGPRPTNKQYRQWTEQQLRASEGMVCLQSGTNKFASQKGMTFGGVRHAADIKADDISLESQGICSLQMGTNKFASQKGMSFGSVRHVADIRCDDVTKEGQGVITLQMGTNQCASQKGMSMGGVRHGADIRCDNMSREGQSTITLQYGTNKFATQSGMTSIGAVRHIADIRVGAMSAEGASHLGLQMGPGAKQVATQSGMTSFGAIRHINDSH